MTVLVVLAAGWLLEHGGVLGGKWTWRDCARWVGAVVALDRLADDGMPMLPGSGWLIGPTVLACAVVVWRVEQLRTEAAKRRALA